MKTEITIRTIPCKSSREAIELAKGWEDRRAVRLDDGPCVAYCEDLDALQAAGGSFAYLGLSGDRVVTVPIN